MHAVIAGKITGTNRLTFLREFLSTLVVTYNKKNFIQKSALIQNSIKKFYWQRALGTSASIKYDNYKIVGDMKKTHFELSFKIRNDSENVYGLSKFQKFAWNKFDLIKF